MFGTTCENYSRWAVSFAHARGIIHRDIKPHNICIDPEKRELTLIDWGLADFYKPGESFNIRVASRYYKPPEILLGYRQYDYSFDLWSVGAILAGMIFRTLVFFKGEDDYDQLDCIAKVLGGEGLRAYVNKYKMTFVDESVVQVVQDAWYPRQPLYEFVHWNNGHLARDSALDLLEKLLVYDHRLRLTADECLAHPFFHEEDDTQVDEPENGLGTEGFRDGAEGHRDANRGKTPLPGENSFEEDDEDHVQQQKEPKGLSDNEVDANDVEVTWADQQNINNFAKMNSKMSDLEDLYEAKKKESEYLDDLETELELADEDELIKYKIGDAFMSLSLTECQERIESERSVIKVDVEKLKTEMDTLQESMDQLKKVLYGKFGKSINLEK
ncbi:hypothetical protein HDV05_000240 [Chytridiales sp. JEL 0842]|nr:hypothetical protein HDV05_000240 [Chytridiales sp. JEL 0842]